MDTTRRPSIVNETTPLIVATEEAPIAISNDHDAIGRANSNGVANEDVAGEDDDRPLPKLQILLLSYARFCEPLSFFCIFPYINQMIAETGDVDVEDVGFYSGLIESLFSLTQMFFMLPYGQVADRIGRKPVLLFCLVGMGVAMAGFGMSQRLWQMILFRCLAGAFGGLVVTVRSMISENSTYKTQAQAFSWFAFASNVGIFVGPIVGGAFSEPAKHYASLFGGVKFWEEHPYALPTFITSAVVFSCLLLSVFLLRETLSKDKPSSLGDGEVTPKKPLSTLEVLRSPGIPAMLWIYGNTMFIAFAFTAVAPLYYYTAVKDGGCGLDPQGIAIFMAVGGISQSLYMLFAFPPLHKRFGTVGILSAISIVWPLSMALYPLGNLLLAQYTPASRTAFWIVGPSITVLLSGVAMAFTSIQIGLNDMTPSPAVLGTLNGIALSFQSALRAFAPAGFSALYTLSTTKQHILGGYLVWLLLVVLTLIFGLSVRFLPKKAYGRVQDYKTAAMDDSVAPDDSSTRHGEEPGRAKGTVAAR